MRTSDDKIGPFPFQLPTHVPESVRPKCSDCGGLILDGEEIYVVRAASSQTGRGYGWHARCDKRPVGLDFDFGQIVSDAKDRKKEQDKKAQQLKEDQDDIAWLTGPKGFKRI